MPSFNGVFHRPAHPPLTEPLLAPSQEAHGLDDLNPLPAAPPRLERSGGPHLAGRPSSIPVTDLKSRHGRFHARLASGDAGNADASRAGFLDHAAETTGLKVRKGGWWTRFATWVGNLFRSGDTKRSSIDNDHYRQEAKTFALQNQTEVAGMLAENHPDVMRSFLSASIREVNPGMPFQEFELRPLTDSVYAGLVEGAGTEEKLAASERFLKEQRRALAGLAAGLVDPDGRVAADAFDPTTWEGNLTFYMGGVYQGKDATENARLATLKQALDQGASFETAFAKERPSWQWQDRMAGLTEALQQRSSQDYDGFTATVDRVAAELEHAKASGGIGAAQLGEMQPEIDRTRGLIRREAELASVASRLDDLDSADAGEIRRRRETLGTPLELDARDLKTQYLQYAFSRLDQALSARLRDDAQGQVAHLLFRLEGCRTSAEAENLQTELETIKRAFQQEAGDVLAGDRSQVTDRFRDAGDRIGRTLDSRRREEDALSRSRRHEEDRRLVSTQRKEELLIRIDALAERGFPGIARRASGNVDGLSRMTQAQAELEALKREVEADHRLQPGDKETVRQALAGKLPGKDDLDPTRMRDLADRAAEIRHALVDVLENDARVPLTDLTRDQLFKRLEDLQGVDRRIMAGGLKSADLLTLTGEVKSARLDAAAELVGRLEAEAEKAFDPERLTDIQAGLSRMRQMLDADGITGPTKGQSLLFRKQAGEVADRVTALETQIGLIDLENRSAAASTRAGLDQLAGEAAKQKENVKDLPADLRRPVEVRCDALLTQIEGRIKYSRELGRTLSARLDEVRQDNIGNAPGNRKERCDRTLATTRSLREMVKDLELLAENRDELLADCTTQEMHAIGNAYPAMDAQLGAGGRAALETICRAGFATVDLVERLQHHLIGRALKQDPGLEPGGIDLARHLEKGYVKDLVTDLARGDEAAVDTLFDDLQTSDLALRMKLELPEQLDEGQKAGVRLNHAITTAAREARHLINRVHPDRPIPESLWPSGSSANPATTLTPDIVNGLRDRYGDQIPNAHLGTVALLESRRDGAAEHREVMARKNGILSALGAAGHTDDHLQELAAKGFTSSQAAFDVVESIRNSSADFIQGSQEVSRAIDQGRRSDPHLFADLLMDRFTENVLGRPVFGARQQGLFLEAMNRVGNSVSHLLDSQEINRRTQEVLALRRSTFLAGCDLGYQEFTRQQLENLHGAVKGESFTAASLTAHRRMHDEVLPLWEQFHDPTATEAEKRRIAQDLERYQPMLTRYRFSHLQLLDDSPRGYRAGMTAVEILDRKVSDAFRQNLGTLLWQVEEIDRTAGGTPDYAKGVGDRLKAQKTTVKSRQKEYDKQLAEFSKIDGKRKNPVDRAACELLDVVDTTMRAAVCFARRHPAYAGLPASEFRAKVVDVLKTAYINMPLFEEELDWMLQEPFTTDNLGRWELTMPRSRQVEEMEKMLEAQIRERGDGAGVTRYRSEVNSWKVACLVDELQPGQKIGLEFGREYELSASLPTGTDVNIGLDFKHMKENSIQVGHAGGHYQLLLKGGRAVGGGVNVGLLMDVLQLKAGVSRSGSEGLLLEFDSKEDLQRMVARVMRGDADGGELDFKRLRTISERTTAISAGFRAGFDLTTRLEENAAIPAALLGTGEKGKYGFEFHLDLDAGASFTRHTEEEGGKLYTVSASRWTADLALRTDVVSNSSAAGKLFSRLTTKMAEQAQISGKLAIDRETAVVTEADGSISRDTGFVVSTPAGGREALAAACTLLQSGYTTADSERLLDTLERLPSTGRLTVAYRLGLDAHASINAHARLMRLYEEAGNKGLARAEKTAIDALLADRESYVPEKLLCVRSETGRSEASRKWAVLKRTVRSGGGAETAVEFSLQPEKPAARTAA